MGWLFWRPLNGPLRRHKKEGELGSSLFLFRGCFPALCIFCRIVSIFVGLVPSPRHGPVRFTDPLVCAIWTVFLSSGFDNILCAAADAFINAPEGAVCFAPLPSVFCQRFPPPYLPANGTIPGTGTAVKDRPTLAAGTGADYVRVCFRHRHSGSCQPVQPRAWRSPPRWRRGRG